LQHNELEKAFAEVIERATGVHPAELGTGKRLRDDLNLDSLTMIDVAVAAEDAFGVQIPDDDLERFATVGDVLDYIRQARATARI
jgi:acyl carrier protein